LPAATAAVYKQWIPNTNFETASNWDKGRVPCARDVVHFEKDKVLSVFVRSPHALTDMYLPLNGEFVLAAGAAFTAFDGSWDPGCDSGIFLSVRPGEKMEWVYWQGFPAASLLQQGCPVMAIRRDSRCPSSTAECLGTALTPVLGCSPALLLFPAQELATPSSWAGYLRGPSAPLQFHGNGTLQVTGTGCPDKSGCACGNALDGPRICAALLRASGRQCPEAACQSPLQPFGHCCGVCGATINLDFTPDFDLQKYQDRLVRELLSQPKYAGVQMAMSKVHKAQTFLGITSRSTTPLIQIVLIDDRAGVQAGTAAEQLAADIMENIAQHGEALGISSGKMEVATGSTASRQVGSQLVSRITAGTVMGLLFSLLAFGGILFLYRKGKLR
ncbi:AMNLS protein, partial [Spelaeornis formosus]|nr:AMNLS protein [Elachura formosa]